MKTIPIYFHVKKLTHTATLLTSKNMQKQFTPQYISFLLKKHETYVDWLELYQKFSTILMAPQNHTFKSKRNEYISEWKKHRRFLNIVDRQIDFQYGSIVLQFGANVVEKFLMDMWEIH